MNEIAAAAEDDINAPIGTNRTRGLNSEFYGRAITGQPYVRKIWYWYAEEASGNIIAEDSPPLGSIINIGGLNSVLTIKKGHLQQLTIRGSVGQNHDISVLNGYLQSCQISGNLAATVYVPKGSISSLNVGGAITVPNHPVFGYEGILARDGINILTANSISNTNIIANKAGSGNIGLIRTTQTFSGSTAKGANLQGSGSSTFGVLVQGTSAPTNSNMNFRGDAAEPFILSGGLAAGTTINISGSLAGSNASITLPANGLKGQIIINSKEGLPANTPDGVWTGEVRVGGVLLENTPQYEIPSAELGGGAVGLVPFHLYKVDSTPESIAPTEGTPEVVWDSDIRASAFPISGNPTVGPAVKVAFYGPVAESNPASSVPPVSIGIMVPDGTNSTFFELTNRFDVVTATAGVGQKSRVVEIRGKQNVKYPPGVYIVAQSTSTGSGANKLVCDIEGTPNVAEFYYYFTVVRDCDANQVADATQLTTSGTNCTDCDPVPNGVLDVCEPVGARYCYADLDLSGEVNDDDFVLFAVAFNNVYDCLGDFNGDGLTDDADFNIFADYYNRVLCSPLDTLEGLGVRSCY
ncbi:MAG: hypothetical protein ACK58T_32130 [Phycisphaerae bacterium]